MPARKAVTRFVNTARRLVLVSIMALLTLGMLSVLIPTSVKAAKQNPDNQVDPVLVYCRDKLGKNAKSACDRKDPNDPDIKKYGNPDTPINIFHARNTASYYCTSARTDNGEMTDCIVKKAKDLIAQAAAKNHSSPSGFEKALNKILNDSEGNPDMPASSSGSTTGGRNCDPQTDGTCPTCHAGSTNTNCINCAQFDCTDAAVQCTKDNCDFISKYVNPAINLVTLVFGILAVGSIIMGGINYSTSEGDPQKVSRAKNRILNTIIAVVAYMFLYGFLQFLVPGGAFH